MKGITPVVLEEEEEEEEGGEEEEDGEGGPRPCPWHRRSPLKTS